jgi:ATP/ADP translocase/HEAT repeat protein
MWGGLPSIRPEERRGALAAFLTVFGILAAHTMLETARDALFLARLPASQLPWVYLLIAAIAVGLSQIPWGGSRRFLGRHGLSILFVALSIPTFVFWATASWRSPAGLYALYVWTGLVGSVAVLEFYIVLGETYTVTQAKRIYRLVGTGSLLGAAAGAVVANLLARSLSAPAIVPAAAATLALTGAGPALLLRRPDSAPAPVRGGSSLAQAWSATRDHAYVRGLAVLMLISTVALTLADYVFKSVVSRHVAPESMGSFFATVYMVLNVLALGVQVALTGWLFRVLGLHRALWALPTLLFLGALGVILGGGLVAVLVLKGADGSLRNSLHRTGSELLYVPLPDALRSRAKPLIDVLGQRGGQALASLLILSEVSLRRGEGVLAAASAALSLVWIAWTADLRSHYLDLFRAALRAGSIGPSPDLPPLDLGSLETLFNALNSADDAEVIGAMDLLAEEKRAHLIPALILHHPSRPVVLRALLHFARSGRADFVPVADRLLAHPDAEVRAAALRARTTVMSDPALLRTAMSDPSPLVQSTALVGLVSGGVFTDELQPTLDRLLASGSRETWVALARAIRAQPASSFADVLLKLVEMPDETVQRQVAHAMGAIGSERFLPALLHLLGQWEPRGAVREALLAYGTRGLEFLSQALAEESLPHEVRRHLPMTIALFPPVEAAPILLSRLLAEPDGMVRFKILRGLNRVGQHPDVHLDPAILRRATETTLQAAFQLVDWRLTLTRGALAEPRRKTPGHELLVTLLHDKEVHAVERLFRLLALQYREEDFKGIYRGLWNRSPKVRASSRELIENLIEPPLRGALLALVDEGPDAERLRRGAPLYAPRPLDYEALLALILEQPGESLRCIAAYHVGELGLTSFRRQLEELKPAETGFFLARVVERALVLLAGGERGTLAEAR